MEKKNLASVVITSDGEKISFSDSVKGLDGSGEIYSSHIGEVLDAAVTANVEWNDVYEYVGPIVHEILVKAVQEDRAAYLELMTAVKLAYEKLKIRHDAKRLLADVEADRL